MLTYNISPDKLFLGVIVTDFSNPRKWPISLQHATRQLILDRLQIDPDNATEQAELARIEKDIKKAREEENKT